MDLFSYISIYWKIKRVIFAWLGALLAMPLPPEVGGISSRGRKVTTLNSQGISSWKGGGYDPELQDTSPNSVYVSRVDVWVWLPEDARRGSLVTLVGTERRGVSMWHPSSPRLCQDQLRPHCRDHPDDPPRPPPPSLTLPRISQYILLLTRCFTYPLVSFDNLLWSILVSYCVNESF